MSAAVHCLEVCFSDNELLRENYCHSFWFMSQAKKIPGLSPQKRKKSLRPKKTKLAVKAASFDSDTMKNILNTLISAITHFELTLFLQRENEFFSTCQLAYQICAVHDI